MVMLAIASDGIQATLNVQACFTCSEPLCAPCAELSWKAANKSDCC